MDTKPVPPLIASLERPCPALWKYYIITALFSGPAIIITLRIFGFAIARCAIVSMRKAFTCASGFSSVVR